jgi:hypothetical protein
MSISINNNNGIIEISQDGSVPKSYFKASGKFYPSGTSGGFVIPSANNFDLISNTLTNVPDDIYTSVPSTTSGSGVGLLFDINIASNVVLGFSTTNGTTPSGYGIGDTATVQGSDLRSGVSGELVFKVISLDIDGLLIVIDVDFYQVKWYNLVIDSTSPTSLGDAQQLLAVLFSTI